MAQEPLNQKKWLRSVAISHLQMIWEKPLRLWGLIRSPGLLTSYDSRDDPPSRNGDPHGNGSNPIDGALNIHLPAIFV